MCLLEEASCCVSHGCEFFVTPTGGGETGSPHPKSGGFINNGRGYFGGRGIAHRPLPHILEVAFYLVSGDFGGGRIGTSPFLLTMPMSTSEEEGQALFLTTSASTSEEEGQAFLLTPSVCTSCSMVEDNDELNILYSLTYHAIAVQGDQQIVTSGSPTVLMIRSQGLNLWPTRAK